MSVVICVFIRDADLPTRDAWQLALDEANSQLVLDEFSPRFHTGFLPARLSGQECGFEYSFGPIESDDIDELGSQLGDRNCIVSFRWQSSELDMQAGVASAAALAKLTGGIYYDTQSGSSAIGEKVYQLLEEEDRQERERRMLLAVKKWGNATSRRCPKCGAPCPEYKKLCSVCKFEIGRVAGS